jgi:hypothetical protein
MLHSLMLVFSSTNIESSMGTRSILDGYIHSYLNLVWVVRACNTFILESSVGSESLYQLV